MAEMMPDVWRFATSIHIEECSIRTWSARPTILQPAIRVHLLIARPTAGARSIAAVGLRGRYNERNHFLLTTTAPVDENSQPSTSEGVFPHFVDGGGYTTQFVLFSGLAGQPSAGLLRFFSASGEPFELPLRDP
jgi:hypothetical protein